MGPHTCQPLKIRTLAQITGHRRNTTRCADLDPTRTTRARLPMLPIAHLAQCVQTFHPGSRTWQFVRRAPTRLAWVLTRTNHSPAALRPDPTGHTPPFLAPPANTNHRARARAQNPTTWCVLLVADQDNNGLGQSKKQWPRD